jgi:hypothetical protein
LSKQLGETVEDESKGNQRQGQKLKNNEKSKAQEKTGATGSVFWRHKGDEVR